MVLFSKKFRESLRLRKIPSVFEILRNFVRYSIIMPFMSKPFLPRSLVFFVVYHCNMRCVMCGIWKENKIAIENQLSLEQFGKILSDPLFRNIESVNLNGGEPNVRSDLLECALLAVEKFPRLKEIGINTNALPGKTVENAEKIANLCRERNIRLGITVSFHGVGEVFDKITGIPNAYEKVTKNLAGLKALRDRFPYSLSLACVLTHLNIYDLQPVIDWGRKEDIHVHFSYAEIRERFRNEDMADVVSAEKQKEVAEAVRFFREISKDTEKYLHQTYRYEKVADMIESGKKRDIACLYHLTGLMLGSDGLLYYCKQSKPLGNSLERSASDIFFDPENLKYRRDIVKNVCPGCLPNTYSRVEAAADSFKLLRFFTGRALSHLFSR